MCKTPTAGDNKVQMIDRNFLSSLPTKLTNHLDLNVEKTSLKLKQNTAPTKKQPSKINPQIQGVTLLR